MNSSQIVDVGDQAPYGEFAPTPSQRRIIRWFHSTPLGFSRFRRVAIARFRDARPGPVDATLFGLKVRFHPHDNQTDSKGAVCGRCYNLDETRWISRFLGPGKVFVDVGANMGFFTLFAANIGAEVIAIEALPNMFERMSFNIALNNFTVHQYNEAVGPTSGTISITPGSDLGGSSILLDGVGINVPMRPLLDIVLESKVKAIDALKIDVEGWEDRVLGPFFANAPRTLWPRAIVIEHSSRELWDDDLLSTLMKLGYTRRSKNRGNSLYVLK